MFASRSVSMHLLRGISGFVMLGLAIATVQFVWPLFLFIPLGLFLLRGCPICWTMGLIETIHNALQKNTNSSADPFCVQCTIKSNKIDLKQ